MTRIRKAGISTLAILAVGGLTAAVSADGLETTRTNLYGNPGLMDMPTAEVAPDGQLSFSHGRFGPTRRTSLTFQITPRMTGTFRYSGLEDFYDKRDIYWDRAFDLRYRLFDEGEYTPAVSIGMRDFLGTGLQSGEYVVATKSIGDSLRVSGGIGWGRLGSYNPTGLSFGTREGEYAETGGQFNYDDWFRGDTALFGGATYALTDKITVVAEYSSDAYAEIERRGGIDVESPFNFGVSYRIGKNTYLNAGYMYGSEVALQFTTGLNPKSPAINGGLEKAPLPVMRRPSRSADALGWSGEWSNDATVAPGIRGALETALSKEGLLLESLTLNATTAEVRFRNGRYAATAEALGRVSRIMTRAFPPSVETFVLTELVSGMPVNSTVLRRSNLEALEFEPAGEMLATTRFVDPLTFPVVGATSEADLYPRNRWSITPYLTASAFDPSVPLRTDVGLRGRVNFEPAPGFVLKGSVAALAAGNIANRKVKDPTTPVAQVRTDSALYSDPIQLESLTANYYVHPFENIYSRLTLGYLERMYGGVSGEVLWKPVNSRIGVGAEVNYAVKRDPDDYFAFEDYDIVTGHASLYYDLGNGFHTQLDAGRYLAGDWGTTVTVNREFNNGWKVGAYATFTDVSADDFGEGSFDKGILLSVPIQWIVGQPTKDRNDLTIQSLNRDGGSRLKVDGRLYDMVRDSQGPEIEDRWGRFWR